MAGGDASRMEGRGAAEPAEEIALDTARWTRLCDLVEEALARAPGERGALLAAACAGDEVLLAEARRMLAADAQGEGFLQPPAGAAAAARAEAASGSAGPPSPAPLLPAPGARIGGFRLLSVLAAGGMGTVFVAEQDAPRRRVALKLLHAGVLSPAHRARFEAEAAILARLHHPHVAQVFDAGVHEEGGLPLPWFALELVEAAQSITEHARERGLGTRARVGLFVPVCDALQHAHERGIVHRDLKPGNLLVDGAGVPRVIDFGVARALDEGLRATALRTTTGQVLGTLPYMSPEQLAGNSPGVDARSDVYSLGVVLYELLAGELPYELGTGSLAEVTRAVQERPPRRPSALRPELRGDLETVLLKALDKDPARRYPRAADLADDLRRWLANRPVEARPASAAHQAALFARRHRALVAAALAVLVVSVGAAIVSIGWALRAEEAESGSRLAAEREARAARLATDAAAQARAAEVRAAGLFGTLLDRSLASTFDFSVRAGALPGGTGLSREMVDAALADLSALREQAGDDVALAARIGLARLRLGDVLGNPTGPNLGDAAGARAQYGAALEEGLALCRSVPASPEARHLVAMARRRLGEHAFFAGEPGQAADLLRASLADFEALAAAGPDGPSAGTARLDVAFAHDKLVAPLVRLADHEGADNEARLAIEGFGAAAEAGALTPGDAAFRIANVRLNVAGQHFVAGRHEQALVEYRAAAEALAPVVAAAPDDVPRRDKLAWARMWIGTTLQALGRDSEAVPELSAALDEYRELARLDPDNINPPVRIAHVAFTLAQVERGAGRTDSARDWCEQALAALEPLEASGRLPGSMASMPVRVREELASLSGDAAPADPEDG